MQCKMKSVKGRRCKAHALKGKHYCMFHAKPGVKKSKTRRSRK